MKLQRAFSATRWLWLAALLLALLAVALTFYPPPKILAQSASLTATVNPNKSVDLAISNHQGNWWFRINSGSCTAVTGTSISGIKGYKPGTYSVKAYSNSNCGTEIADTTFTILATSLAATVDSADRSVDLTITNGPSPWYFRIGYGSCTTVNGTTISGIKGYKAGYHEVLAFATAGCSDALADAYFVIPDPPPSNATLTTTVTAGPAANLTLTNGPSNNNWWFRINSWGTCTAVTGTNTFNNIRGYKAGTHSVDAYSDDGCYTKIASSSFTIPAFAATRKGDWSVDLTLTGWSANWWFKIGWWGDCTAASGTTVGNIRGYKSGWYIVGVYPAAGCAAGDHIAMDSFTIPTATLTATVNTNRSVDLNLSNGPDNWWFRINYWGTCTAAPGTTVSGIAGYKDGTHAVAAYSDSGCNYHVTATTFTIVPPTLTASGVTNTGATLTIANHTGQWWYQADTGPHATCQGPVATNTSTRTLTGLTPSATYTYKAYSATGCNSNDLLATASAFTTLSPSLTATSISGTGATLNMTGYTSAWSYKRTAGPSNTTCSDISAGNTTATLGSLTADTLYGYTSYSGSGCTTANKLDTVHFSTTNYGVGNLDEVPAAGVTCQFGAIGGANTLCAVAFTTGAQSGGYTLKNVSGNFAAKYGTPSPVSVAIHAADSNNSSNPASSATVTLSGSDPDTAGLYTYTCSGSGCDLSASTTYFVVLSTPDTAGLNRYSINATASGAETAHPATNGWSIADSGLVKSGANAWASTGSYVPMLHVAADDLAPTVSNLSETSTQGSPSTSGGAWIANEFTTGSNTGGYTVTDVTVPISPGGGASNVTLRIFSGNTGNADPNSSLVTLTNTGDTAGNYTFSCSGSCDLTASTDYFLVLNSDSGYSHSWASTASDNQTSSAGWSIGNTYTASTNSGTSWTADANSHATKFSIMATPK